MRVLFVVKEYLPKPTPPGVCVMNIQEALFKKGVQSDVLMTGDKEGFYSTSDIGDVYSIRSGISFETKKENIFVYLKVHIPMLITWPVPSKRRVNDYRKYIKKLNDERHYDAIIGTMFPADVCVACSSFKHFFLYELDSLINNPVYKKGIKKYLKHRLFVLEKYLFERAELIIHLNNNAKFYSRNRYKIYATKSEYTDLPCLINCPEKYSCDNISSLLKDKELSADTMLMVYSGHLDSEYRSPVRLIELIEALSKTVNIKCLFFSRGDCEIMLREAERLSQGTIKRMGYVSQEVLGKYIEKADFLLDIGNHLTGDDYSLPSKVISYMATGKPIIHMNGTNDSAIPYLEKYGLAINVRDDISIDEAKENVLEFIKDNKNIKIPFEEVIKLFPQNTPEYTAEIIINQVQKRNSD